MTNKEESINLDKILNELQSFESLNPYNFLSIKKLSSKVNISNDLLIALCDKLVDFGYIKKQNSSSYDYMLSAIMLTSKGKIYLNKGGFGKDYEKDSERRKKEKEIRDLQLEDLKNKVGNFELESKKLREEIQKNREHIKLMVEKRKHISPTFWLSVIAFLLSLISIFFK